MYYVKDTNQSFNTRPHPPTLICTAEVDVLCSEGEAYGEALRARGVEAGVRRFNGVPHNFTRETELLLQAAGYVVLSIERTTKALTWPPAAGDAIQNRKPWVVDSDSALKGRLIINNSI